MASALVDRAGQTKEKTETREHARITDACRRCSTMGGLRGWNSCGDHHTAQAVSEVRLGLPDLLDSLTGHLRARLRFILPSGVWLPRVGHDHRIRAFVLSDGSRVVLQTRGGLGGRKGVHIPLGVLLLPVRSHSSDHPEPQTKGEAFLGEVPGLAVPHRKRPASDAHFHNPQVRGVRTDAASEPYRCTGRVWSEPDPRNAPHGHPSPHSVRGLRVQRDPVCGKHRRSRIRRQEVDV